jgi:hypothetical protein
MKVQSLLFGASFLFATAAAAKPVAISGVVLNGTSGKPLASAPVQLVQPKTGDARTTIGTVTTDASGHFSFPAKDYGAGSLLMVSAKHQGYEYWRIAYDGGNKLQSANIQVNPAKVQLKVYDVSTAAVPIEFQAHHIAIESAPDGIKCVERIVVLNGTKTTFMGIGPRKITVSIELPKGAKDVKLDPKIADAKLFQTSDGWGIEKVIPPDEYTPMGEQVRLPNVIIINYKMDWPSILPWAKKVDLSRTIHYPTKFFFVARTTGDKSLQVTAPKLSPDEEQQLPIDGDMQTRIVNAIGAPMMPEAALHPENQLSIQVSKPGNPLIWAFAGLTLAICLFIPIAMTRPKRGLQKISNSSEPRPAGIVNVQTSPLGGFSDLSIPLNGFGTQLALTPESQELIERIAELDDRYEAGQLEGAEYQAQRSAWKKQLIESLGSPPQ